MPQKSFASRIRIRGEVGLSTMSQPMYGRNERWEARAHASSLTAFHRGMICPSIGAPLSG